ncbi:APC family permease [Microbulbifer sp. SAOS-129_SWC]|uniref:APC family permease n=1 Tax=Microbulbifer sp. SAOS-129_SWC TaxID=3145235 RepID=UPI0032163181
MSKLDAKLGLQATWSMAVGGMIGGGIFSTLGVVIEIAGAWAWVSFLVAGLIALATGYCYAELAEHYEEGGGAYTYLRKVNAHGFAGSLAWILIVGYVLTNAVYAFTFGQYLGHVMHLGPIFSRASAVGIMSLFIALNLRGVAEAGWVEIFLVWIKLVVLLGLAIWGIASWQPDLLARGTEDKGLGAAMFGAASVFMAYEGFQLLAYGYDDIENPNKNLRRAMLAAIAIVIVTYVLVAIGTAMLIGSDQVVQHKEVALSIAGEKALGTTGLIIVTIAAAFSTGSAINSTLFATARLSLILAEAGDLPKSMSHRNDAGMPDRGVMILGVAAALMAAVGNLEILVKAASLAFLLTFAVVCGLAFDKRAGRRSISGFGAVSASAAAVALVLKLAEEDPLALMILGGLIVLALFGKPLVLYAMKKFGGGD